MRSSHSELGLPVVVHEIRRLVARIAGLMYNRDGHREMEMQLIQANRSDPFSDLAA